jgi:hypothetical protein
MANRVTLAYKENEGCGVKPVQMANGAQRVQTVVLVQLVYEEGRVLLVQTVLMVQQVPLDILAQEEIRVKWVRKVKWV